MAISFNGKVAIVTGAGAGLGKQHALELARRGAKVVVNDLGGSVDGSGGSSAAAQAVVAEIKAFGGDAIANGASVADRVGAETIINDAVKAFGRLDILINNAGILRDKTFKKMELDDFELVMKVHLLGSMYCTKAAWPIMLEQNYGRIVMTTSSSGLYGNFGQSNYGAAKLGLVGFMNTLKIEGAKNNVKVNTIAPVAATRMTENLGIPEALFGRLKPELVTPAVVYLCSEDAPTGTIIEAGAGYYAKVQVTEGKGVKLGDNVTVEDIAANWDKITDMSAATPFPSGSDVTKKIFSVTSHFDRETALTPIGEGRFAGRVGRDFWVQSGPNGGYLAAIAMRAARAIVPEPERVPRSMHARYLAAPKEGEIEVLAEVLRRGRSMTSVAMRIQQGGQDCVHVSAAFSIAFSPIAFQDVTMPSARPLAECVPLTPEIPLNHRLDMLPAIGAARRSGDRAITGGYVRFADPRPIDTLALASLWDMWPPAVFARAFDQRFRGAVPTVEASVYFRRPVPLPNASPSDYVLIKTESTMAHEGLVEESGEIWSHDGLLLVQSRQLALLM